MTSALTNQRPVLAPAARRASAICPANDTSRATYLMTSHVSSALWTFFFFIQKGWALTMIKKLTCYKITWGIYSLLFIVFQYQSCGKMSLLPFSRCNESNELIGQKLLQPWLQYVIEPDSASKYSGLSPSHTLFINNPIYGFPFTANIAM